MADIAYDMARRIDAKKPHKSRGNWVCRCPSHKDDEPSLGITAQGGKLVYRCYAGCSFDQIADGIRQLGWNPFTGEPDDGWRPGDPPRHGKHATRPATRAGAPAAAEKADPLEGHRYDPAFNPAWIDIPGCDRPAPEGYRQTRYVYRNEDNVPTMLVHRYDKVDATVEGRKKTLVTITPWVREKDNKLMLPPLPAPSPMTPYGGETLKREGTIWVVEGEKCRDALDGLLRHRFPVISTYGSKPDMANLSVLKDRPWIVVRDLDLAGESYAEAIGRLGRPAKAGADDHGATIPPTWRGGLDNRPPKGWDIADEILGKQVPGLAPVAPLTLPEFLAHIIRCAKATKAHASEMMSARSLHSAYVLRNAAIEVKRLLEETTGRNAGSRTGEGAGQADAMIGSD